MNNKNFEWNKEIIQQHLDNKNYQKLNIKDKKGWTGFILACLFEPELAETMLQKDNIDFNIQNDMGVTGFLLTCVHQPRLAKVMLEKDNINIQDNDGNTGFIFACIHQSELVKIMLDNKKIDKELKNKDGLTGYDLAKEENLKSFEIYQSWLEHENINSQVQKRSKKPSQHL